MQILNFIMNAPESNISFVISLIMHGLRALHVLWYNMEQFCSIIGSFAENACKGQILKNVPIYCMK